MTFPECVQVCAEHPDLLEQFDRLTGHHLSTLNRRTPMEAKIDEATGRDAAAAGDFLNFVWNYVWATRKTETP